MLYRMLSLLMLLLTPHLVLMLFVLTTTMLPMLIVIPNFVPHLCQSA